MNSICNVYGKHSPQSKTSRCSSSSVTDRNMCSYSLGQRGEINLQAGVENNTILFFQNSWLRTLCPKCSQVKHPSWFPALRGGKNSAAGLASNKQNLGVATMCRHTASTVSVTLDSLDWGLRHSGRQRVVKTCWSCHCIYITERVTRSRFCKEKEKRPRKLSKLHRLHAVL